MKHTDKGRSVFVGLLISKGEYICQYDGELITSNILKERNHEYNTSGAGSFVILEFKFQDKKWALDATIENGSFSCLINHSKKFQNVKPTVSNLNGKPSVFFIATKDISKDEELFFDYGDNSKKSQCNFPWLKK